MDQPPAAVPRYSIARTDRGWLLLIQDDTCSVMQVFNSEPSARHAVDRMLEFFQSVSGPRSDQSRSA